MRVLAWVALLAGLTLMVVALMGFIDSHQADPWCGPGSYYDFNHAICQGFRSPPPSNGQLPPNYYDDQGAQQ